MIKHIPTDPAKGTELVIPEGTQFVIMNLDHDGERVQVEFSLNGKVIRAWVAAAHFEHMLRN